MFRRGGLYVASEASDEDSIARALKRFDRDLILTWELDAHGRRVYEVHKIVSRDRPALLVLRWAERGGIGEPIPLSHALLDEVARLQRGGTVEAFEDGRRAERERERREMAEEAYETTLDMWPRIRGVKSSPAHPGVNRKRGIAIRNRQG